MKKKIARKKPIKYEYGTAPTRAEEPAVPYPAKNPRTLPSLKDFTYNEFKKIASKAPLTQAEWAAILHISERTLQRYAKDNSTFAAINAERALLIEKLIKEGNAVFGSAAQFYSWLKTNPYMLEGNLSFEMLTTTEGIQRVMTQLGRIQHGILA